MLVQQLLKAKGDDGVVTVLPSCPVSEAAATLSARRIGAVVISEDGKVPLGILSERDIVRELGRRGPGCLADTVDKIMTPNPVSCSRDQSAGEVLVMMTEGRFRHLPVIEAGEMIGLISIGDAVKARLQELASVNEALEGMIMGF